MAGMVKPLFPFEYPLALEGEPSHRPEGMPSLHPMKRSCEVARSNRSNQVPTGRNGGHAAVELAGRSTRGITAGLATTFTL